MPTDRRPHRPHAKLKKPWHARIKNKGIAYSVGYFATWEEAKAAETEFRTWIERADVDNQLAGD